MNRAVDGRILRTEMACWTAIALQAVQHRRSQGSLWLSWTLLALALVSGALAPIAPQPLKMASFGIGIPVAMLVLMWWTFLIDSIRRQYHPAAARLVPLLPQRLKTVAALAWLLGASALAVVVGIPIGHPGLVFTIAALAMLEVARARAYLLIIAFGLLMWLQGPVEALLTLLVTSPAAAPAGLAVLVLEGRSTLRHLFGGPGLLPTLGADGPDGRA